MSAKDNQLKRMRTWYALEAVIEIRSRGFHRAGFGKLLIPHPPAVNWLLRYGLPDKPYYRLSMVHEFGHFQTLPILLIYVLWSVRWLFTRASVNVLELTVVFLSIHSMAEILAEGYVYFKIKGDYRDFYGEASLLPRLAFWTIFLLISAAGWLVLLNLI